MDGIVFAGGSPDFNLFEIKREHFDSDNYYNVPELSIILRLLVRRPVSRQVFRPLGRLLV